MNSVHADDELMPAAEELVERLAHGPTRSYAGSKRALNRMIYPDLDGQLDLEAEIQHALARTDDFLEGVVALRGQARSGVQGRLKPAGGGSPAGRRI